MQANISSHAATCRSGEGVSFATTGQRASQRPPDERQNGEANASDYNTPQRCGRRIRVGPFGAIQRMFVRGHLPLPLGPAESLQAPLCHLRVG
jgi:hypothetical protein